jgi:hypothetical protein
LAWFTNNILFFQKQNTCRLGHREVEKKSAPIVIARRFNGIVFAQFNNAFGFVPLFIIRLGGEVGDRTKKKVRKA